MNNSNSPSISTSDLYSSFIALHFANSVEGFDNIALLTAVESFDQQDVKTAKVLMEDMNFE